MAEDYYVCPMHPEVRQRTPGRCPKCGMALVLEEQAAKPPVLSDRGLGTITWKSYGPLLTILGLILLVTFVLSWRDSQEGIFSWPAAISYFMIGFFLVFSGFKLLDLRGFADGYATYDLLSQRFFPYGYVYPFIELGFGLAMLSNFQPTWLLWTELIVMTFSGLGVAVKLAKKEQFQCACLGTFLKLPLTKVTLVEDFGMAALALGLLLISR